MSTRHNLQNSSRYSSKSIMTVESSLYITIEYKASYILTILIFIIYRDRYHGSVNLVIRRTAIFQVLNMVSLPSS